MGLHLHEKYKTNQDDANFTILGKRVWGEYIWWTIYICEWTTNDVTTVINIDLMIICNAYITQNTGIYL